MKMNSKSETTNSIMNTLSSPVVTVGVPLAAVAGISFYFYKQNSTNVKKISELEQKVKMMEETIFKQKEQLDMVIAQFQQAFGTLQNQVQGMNQQIQRYPTKAAQQPPPPPSYSPEDDDMDDVPREIKKTVNKKSNKSVSLSEQAREMERERGHN